VCDDPERVLPRASRIVPIAAPRAGVIHGIEADAVGMAALVLGAGRRTKDDVLDPAAGLVMICARTDRVDAGQPLAMLHTNLPDGDPSVADATARFLAAVHIGDRAITLSTNRTLEVLR
jgi:pyrimidine-nucleoside phosphorylase